MLQSEKLAADDNKSSLVVLYYIILYIKEIIVMSTYRYVYVGVYNDKGHRQDQHGHQNEELTGHHD